MLPGYQREASGWAETELFEWRGQDSPSHEAIVMVPISSCLPQKQSPLHPPCQTLASPKVDMGFLINPLGSSGKNTGAYWPILVAVPF